MGKLRSRKILDFLFYTKKILNIVLQVQGKDHETFGQLN